MDEAPELNTYVLEAVLKVVRSIPELHDAEAECSNLTKCQDEVADALVSWRSKQSDIHARNLGLFATASGACGASTHHGEDGWFLRRGFGAFERRARALTREGETNAN
ncbi:hypothetical protein Mapa_006344 [Marchantia paleacea]|nr:hypothetical protein Mapa_006344 [Marchantia paleacea]